MNNEEIIDPPSSLVNANGFMKGLARQILLLYSIKCCYVHTQTTFSFLAINSQNEPITFTNENEYDNSFLDIFVNCRLNNLLSA